MELSDLEINQIRRFLADDVMTNAVRKIILHGVTKDLKIDFDKLNNQEIGERYRAREEAETLIKKGFNELEVYRAVEEPKEKTNPAR